MMVYIADDSAEQGTAHSAAAPAWSQVKTLLNWPGEIAGLAQWAMGRKVSYQILTGL